MSHFIGADPQSPKKWTEYTMGELRLLAKEIEGLAAQGASQ